MFFFVFGLPGEFTRWCETVAAELARRAGGSAELLHADTLEQIALNAIGTGAAHVVVSSRQPGGRLRGALIDSRRNFVVALDDPRAALIDLVLGQGIELATAVRMLASSCAALRGVAAVPGALTLRGGRDEPPPADTVPTIARHLQIDIGDAAIADLVAGGSSGGAAEPPGDATGWWDGLDTVEQELVIGALMPFVDDRAERGPLSIAWGRDLFFLGDEPAERANRPIDITGRARCLLRGPDIILPPGRWSLTLTAHFSREASEHEFLAEICADRPLASGALRPPQEGNAEITLDFALDDASEHPIALRLSSQRAAFDGAIVVVGATVVRVSDSAAAGPTPEGT